MKHPNHFGRWLACVLLCLLLAGCSMPGEQVQVEELLRAPKLSGDYGDVQTALNDWLGESAQLKYPMQGDLLSPFLLQDLDGDGRQDAAVLYTTAQSSNVCIAILQKDDADIWHVRQNVEGLADTVESVGWPSCSPAMPPNWWWVIQRHRATIIWLCIPTPTACFPRSWSSSTSSIWWRISPAAAIRT